MGPMGTIDNFFSDSFDGGVRNWRVHGISIHNFVFRNVAWTSNNHRKCQFAWYRMVFLLLDSGVMQTLCLIIYCSTPIMFLSIAVFLMNITLKSFLLNLILAIAALLFTIRSNKGLFKSLVAGDRQILSLYPVFLFYTFMCLFIAMTWCVFHVHSSTKSYWLIEYYNSIKFNN